MHPLQPRFVSICFSVCPDVHLFQLCGLWLGLTLGMLPLFFIDDNLDNRAHDSQEFLSGTKSEWFVMDDQNRKVNADEYCEVFSGE